MSSNDHGGGVRARRALLLGDADSAAALDARLAGAGYETLRADADDAAQVAWDEEPDVVLVLLGEPDGDEADEPVALARRLRADERTFSLPLALVFTSDTMTLRLAALGVGADDYFALSTPTAELCARLDSLLWRAEAGRLVPPPTEEDATVAGSAEPEAATRPADARAEEKAEETPADAARTDALTAPHEQAQAYEQAGGEASAAPDEGSGGTEAPDGATGGEDRAREVSAEEVARALDGGRHTRPPAHTTREARLIAALDASTERLTRAGARHPGQHAASNAHAARARRPGGPKRLLLIISDAARMAQLNLLIRSAHYEVRTAFDARQALSLLRIERPDLLLVDYELKDMDGVEMLRRLREQQGGRAGPPALLFAPAGREDLQGAAGARAVVTLPYNPDELLDLIHAAGGAD